MDRQEPEIELVKRAQQGDSRAFDALTRQYMGTIQRVCRATVPGAEDAEDLAIEAFVDAYLKLDQLRDPSAFGGWLYRIAKNACHTWLRKQRPLPDEVIDDVGKVPEGVDLRIAGALQKIQPEHREMVSLFYWAGLSYAEISTVLEIPEGTVMSRLHRAKASIKRILEDPGMPVPIEAEEEVSQQVELEIRLLQELADEGGKPTDRLEVVLAGRPEKFVALARSVTDDDLRDYLAVLMRRSILAVAPVVVAALLSETDQPELQDCCRRWIRTKRKDVTDVHVFVDVLIRASASDAKKAEILVDLVNAIGSDDQRRDIGKVWSHSLLRRVLLSYEEVAFPLLWDRFLDLDMPGRTLQIFGVPGTLGWMPDRFCDKLVGLLHSEDIRSRDRALTGLEAVLLDNVQDSETVSAVKGALEASTQDADTMIRERATRLLGKAGFEDAEQTMLQLLNSEDQSTRRTAAQGLGALPTVSDEGIAALVSLLDDASSSVRKAGLEALARHESDAAKDRYLEMIESDEDPKVREAAVAAFGEVANEFDKQYHLQNLARGGDRRMAKAAARVLYDRKSRKQTALEKQRVERIRAGGTPRSGISTIGAIRAFPEVRPFKEGEVTTLIAGVCNDWATTRRYLVTGVRNLMFRDRGVYQMTELGKSVWRVERYIQDNVQLERAVMDVPAERPR